MLNKKSTYKDTSVEEFELLMTNIANSNDNQFRLYFAGPWFTEKAWRWYDVVSEVIKKNNGIFTSVYFPRDCQSNNPKEVFTNNINELEDCDVVVALIDEKDTGTAMEIGYAYALGKPVFLLGLDETSFNNKTNLMLAFAGEPITIDEFVKYLKRLDFDFVKIKNDFEVLE